MSRILWPNAALLIASLAPAIAQQKTLDQPVGLVLSSRDTMLIRSGTNLPLTAQPGNILFAGDSLKSGAKGSAVFLHCPTNSSQQLAEASEIAMERRQWRVVKGRIVNQTPAPICTLPLLERNPNAAEQDYGASAQFLANDAAAVQPSGQPGNAPGQELAAIEAVIGRNADDLPARVARAAMLEKSGLHQDAFDEYARILAEWPGAEWAGFRQFAAGQQARSVFPVKPADGAQGGKTYALIVGVSTYKDKNIRQLQFAHKDAELLAQHLRSPRGGGLTDAEITLLTNEAATLPAVRNRMHELIQLKAGKADTIVLFFASHGTSAGDDGYILTTESDPQYLNKTALSMKEVQDLFQEKLKSVGRVVLYVDVCHAGVIGSIRGGNKINDIVSTIADANEIFGLLASRRDGLSYEGEEFGGHGVFSKYLVEALNGSADKNHDGIVNAVEVSLYVQEQVSAATQQKKPSQYPREIGNADTTTILADLKKPGLPVDNGAGPTLVTIADTAPVLPGSRGIDSAGGPAGSGPNPESGLQALKDFEEALRAGRLLPDVDGSAFHYLPALRENLPAREYIVQSNRLRVALENLGQEVLLTYLKGHEEPQTQKDFRTGANLFAAARLLTPESQLLQARLAFCLGRALLYERDFPAGVGMLELAARIDADSAYAYNALGIAYLEQARYDYAESAFRDAIQRAPYWAYPHYNLALTYSEEGAYGSAEREYREAIRVAPGYAYVHYSLGLLLHKLGRKAEAEREYRTAIQKNANRPEPYVGLGALDASSGKKAEAERNYRTAIGIDPKLAAAAHDLGLLYAREKKPDLAIQTWEDNIAINAEFIPSRMSLAKIYRDTDRYDLAVAQYQAVLASAPHYAAADMELKETEGDRHRQEGRMDLARQEYQSALAIAVSDGDRKRLRDKLRK